MIFPLYFMGQLHSYDFIFLNNWGKKSKLLNKILLVSEWQITNLLFCWIFFPHHFLYFWNNLISCCPRHILESSKMQMYNMQFNDFSSSQLVWPTVCHYCHHDGHIWLYYIQSFTQGNRFYFAVYYIDIRHFYFKLFFIWQEIFINPWKT